MKSIGDRCIDMVRLMEWFANFNDGTGNRCPNCGVWRSVGKHTPSCDLGYLCEDLRTIERAEKLKSGT